MKKTVPSKAARRALRLAAERFDASAEARERVDLDRCLAVLRRVDHATYRTAGLVDLKSVLPPAFHRVFEGHVDALWLLRRRRVRVARWIPRLDEHRFIAASENGETRVMGRSAIPGDAERFEEVADRMANALAVPLRRSTRVEPLEMDWTVTEDKFRRFFWLSLVGTFVSPISTIPTVLLVGLPLLFARRFARQAKKLSTHDDVHPWDKVEALARAAGRVGVIAAVVSVLCAAVTVLFASLAFIAFLEGFTWGHFNAFGIGVALWMAVIPALMAARAHLVLRTLRDADDSNSDPRAPPPRAQTDDD